MTTSDPVIDRFDGPRVLAIIPARGGSKGIPGKNKKLFGGKPLVSYPILAARQSRLVSRVICSTDDPEIAELAIRFGAEVPRLRPAALATDETSTIDVVIDVLETDDEVSNTIIVLEPTSPLTTANDIDMGLSTFLESKHAPSLISISHSVSGHPQYTFRVKPDETLESILGKNWKFKRRQELEPLYFQDGSLYISSRMNLLKNRSFISNGTLGLLMPKYKSFELDDELDWVVLETILSKVDVLERE